MCSLKKPRGSIHKIREFELEKIHLVDEFDILQIVGEGWFGKILLVEHRASQTEMVLKAVPKPYVSLRDFYREFHYGLHLGIHRNIVTTYDVAFETAGFYVFTQEYAPLGDLTSNVTDTGIGELHSKRVAKQIASALDYMHSKDIVHRDVKLDNVLIYRSDFSRVKLCDFGESYQTGTIVERRNEWLPYSPPEVLQIKPEETYKADASHDVWQFGIVIFVCLTGCLPWQKAASDDPRYVRYLAWQGTMMLPIRRIPKLFKLLSSRASRMFRRFLEPRVDRRPKNLSDLTKFMDDRWLAKSAEKDMAEYEPDELCPSMYSFHSSPDEKNRLLYTLVECGIETNVDRQTKKNRIKDWIESSVITEEDEVDEDIESVSVSPSSSVSREPVAGHISSIRLTKVETKKDIKTTLKDATQKHFDPRTGALQEGPSEMGTCQNQNESPSPTSNMSLMNNDDSLRSSLVTLGSRNDLISSDMQLYSSDVNLNMIGDPVESERKTMVNRNGNVNQYSLSSSHLLTADQQYNYNTNNTLGSVMKSSIAVGNGKVTKGILQRTRSNSANVARANSKMYASSPAIDATLTSNNNSTLSPDTGANSSKQKSNHNKSVTFVGLANAFQSLAQISRPSAAMTTATSEISVDAEFESGHNQNFNYFHQSKDFQVKDSGYGSYDKIRTSGKGETEAKETVKSAQDASSNTNGASEISSSQHRNSSHLQQHKQHTNINLPTTSTGYYLSTMKDTAYDHVTVARKRK